MTKKQEIWCRKK